MSNKSRGHLQFCEVRPVCIPSRLGVWSVSLNELIGPLVHSSEPRAGKPFHLILGSLIQSISSMRT